MPSPIESQLLANPVMDACCLMGAGRPHPFDEPESPSGVSRSDQLEQQLPRTHRLAGLHLNRLQYAIHRGANLDLHLHGLDHQHRFVLPDGLPAYRQYGGNAPGNGRAAKRILQQFEVRARARHALGNRNLAWLPVATTVVRVLQELDRHFVAFLFDVNPEFHFVEPPFERRSVQRLQNVCIPYFNAATCTANGAASGTSTIWRMTARSPRTAFTAAARIAWWTAGICLGRLIAGSTRVFFADASRACWKACPAPRPGSPASAPVR